jgi:hypothetical protein
VRRERRIKDRGGFDGEDELGTEENEVSQGEDNDRDGNGEKRGMKKKNDERE